MSAPRVAELALFLRPPVAGEVKTRLARQIGAEAAAELYAAFVQDTLALVLSQPRLVPRLWVAGEPDHAALSTLGIGVPRERQPAGDLGERLAAALGAGLERSGAVIALGTDAPTVPPAYLVDALAALSTASVVLGPAADGGYYLIGLRCDPSEVSSVLAGVRWSSPHTLADTVARAHEAGLTTRLLTPWYDVDTERDLALLRLHLTLSPGAAPATARLLAAGGSGG